MYMVYIVIVDMNEQYKLHKPGKILQIYNPAEWNL